MDHPIEQNWENNDEFINGDDVDRCLVGQAVKELKQEKKNTEDEGVFTLYEILQRTREIEKRAILSN